MRRDRSFLRNQSASLSKELNKWGLNLNFAPCADVNTNPNNPIIGERAFANNPNDVIKGMNIFIEETRNPEDREQVEYINREMDSTFVHGKVHRRKYLINNHVDYFFQTFVC